MIKLSIKTLIICSILALTQSVQAQNGEYAKTIKLKTETNVANLEIAKKDNYIKAKYASAENRFLQGNVKATLSVKFFYFFFGFFNPLPF